MKVRISLICTVFFVSLAAQSVSLSKLDTLFKHQQYIKALEFIKHNQEDMKTSSRFRFLSGKTYFMLEKFGDAVDAFQKAIDLDENNAEYHLWLGHAYGLQARTGSKFKAPFRAKHCKNEYEKAVKLDPDLVEARISLIQYYMQAPGFLGGGMDKAKVSAKELISVDSIQGYLMLATVQFRDDQPDSAAIHLQNALKLDPNQANALNSMGYYYLQRKEYEMAKEYFERQLEAHPEKANGYDSMGDWYRVQGEFKNAIDWYQKALEMNGQFYPAIFKMATCYTNLGDQEAAIARYNKIINGNFNENLKKEAKKRREKLESNGF